MACGDNVSNDILFAYSCGYRWRVAFYSERTLHRDKRKRENVRCYVYPGNAKDVRKYRNVFEKEKKPFHVGWNPIKVVYLIHKFADKILSVRNYGAVCFFQKCI